jgi:hypothetical protein
MKQRILNTVVFAVIGSVVALAALIPSIANAQSVTIGTIPAASFCSGDPISVSFTATGYWQHRNAFTLQLSDPSGRFTSGFTNLGSIKDTLPGTFTISDTIPGNLAGSTHYRFRIMAALPYMTSADNGSDIAIGQVPNPRIDFPQLQAAIVNSPIGIYAYTNGSNIDTFYWNFGDGATPATAVGMFGDTVTYSTGDMKIVSVREASAGGCSATVSDTFQVYDCTAPVIPHDAVVLDADTVYRTDNMNLWVDPGVIITLWGQADTIFAEPGSTINYNGDEEVFYLKAGAIANGSDINVTVAASGSSAPSGGLLLWCPSLDFDYTNAPPNAIMPAGVNVASVPVVVRISPNPATGRVEVDGLPNNARDISLENVLGTRVGEWTNSGSHILTLDLSKYPAGPYYLRFVSGMTVITKKIVLE